MNVLIVLEHGRISGVNSFARALSILFKKHGHRVYFNVIDKHTKYYNYVTEHGWGYYDGRVDIDLCVHNYASSVQRFYRSARLNIFITHGTQHKEYVPPFDLVDSVWYLSGQQRDYYGSSKGDLIHNLIESRGFKTKPRRKLRRVLLADVRYGDFYAEKVKEACDYLDLEFYSVPRDSEIYDLRDYIDRKGIDIVIGYGRCVIEAMSIGRPVIVYGINGGDGYLKPEDFDLVAYKNFSGYAKRTMYTPPRIEPIDFYVELKKYIYLDGHKLIERACKYELNRIRIIVDDSDTRSGKEVQRHS